MRPRPDCCYLPLSQRPRAGVLLPASRTAFDLLAIAFTLDTCRYFPTGWGTENEREPFLNSAAPMTFEIG
jgi:hypothetical protein